MSIFFIVKLNLKSRVTMEVIWLISLGALIYYGYKGMQAKRKVDELQEFLAHPLVGRLVVNYLSCVIREEQLKISWNIIANYLGCLPSEVVLVCYAFLDNLNLSDKELHQLKKQWELEKFRQAKMFNIGYDVTPAAIMESLIAQYIQLKQK